MLFFLLSHHSMLQGGGGGESSMAPPLLTTINTSVCHSRRFSRVRARNRSLLFPPIRAKAEEGKYIEGPDGGAAITRIATFRAFGLGLRYLCLSVLYSYEDPEYSLHPDWRPWQKFTAKASRC